ERASARETAARVAAGAVARCFLGQFGVAIRSRVVSIGTVQAPQQTEAEIDWEAVENSDVRAAGAETERLFRGAIDNAKRDGTTVGGVFQVVAFGAPVGLGSHVQWDRKLDGRLARAMMSINAVKGVEVGRGFANTRRPGSEVHDVVVPDARDPRRFSRLSNEAGGIEGGMTNGEPVVVFAAMKPIATMQNALPSVDINTGEVVNAPYHRSDTCQVPPACVVGEAAMASVLADAFLEKFGGDHIDETRRNYEAYVASHQAFGGNRKG
ncbi:MAG: chorismate synthase, partial [Chloroflexi bacterium]|nr:chorismate synthase [Chloroflexota bacterium]